MTQRRQRASSRSRRGSAAAAGAARAARRRGRAPPGRRHPARARPIALAPYPAKLTERLEYWAAAAPERPFLAQRDRDGRLAQAQLSPDARAGAPHRRRAADARPLARAADRDPLRQRHRACAARPCRHLCRHPLRADLARLFADLERLRQASHTSSTCSRPASSSRPTATPTAAPSRRWCRPTSRWSVTRNPIPGRPSDAVRGPARPAPRPPPSTPPTRKVGPDTIAKFLFTSGSTGMPKGVINTQRMWCSNQAMIRTALAYLRGRAAGDRRLVALAPHRRRQPRFRLRALQRRHASTSTRASRRRARSKPRCGTCARSRPPGTSRCRRATRRCCPISVPTTALRQDLLQPAQGAVVRGRRALAVACSTRCRSWRWRPAASASCS